MINKTVVIFDLDDTLYFEIDFLKSAYLEIAQTLIDSGSTDSSVNKIFEEMFQLFSNKKNVFHEILIRYKTTNYTVNDLIYKYRNHAPNISLSTDTITILDYLKENNIEIGIITDGRSKQQRSKINALGLNKYANHIIISEEIGSEKPSLANYKCIEEKFKGVEVDFFYIGDNIQKDFVTPNKLGWHTVCLKDKGLNIHSQDIEVRNEYKPVFEIESIIQLKDIILAI